MPATTLLIAAMWGASGVYSLVIVALVAKMCVDAGPQYVQAINIPGFFETFGTLGLGFFIGQVRVVVRMLQTQESPLGKWTQVYVWSGFGCLLLIVAAVLLALGMLVAESGPKSAAELKIPNVFTTWGITSISFLFAQFFDLVIPLKDRKY